ncbi:MAG: hypothetical protein IMF07_04910 [Proteobacteria bacterium]|nr:hypothetical protein [Pseudomonadota bacterium]
MTRLFSTRCCLKAGNETAREKGIALLLLAIIALAGCGKKGPPLPPLITLPETVQSFAIEGRDEGLLLSWRVAEKNIADLAGFRLHRQSEAKGCTSCPSRFPLYKDVDIDLPHGAKIENGVLYLLDAEVERGFIYRYKVVPYSRSGYEGPFSRTVTASWSMPPQAPTALKSEPGDRSVRISWSELQGPAPAGYRVYRTNRSQLYGKTPVNQRLIETMSYTDIGLENNRQYYYVVKALIREGATLIEGPASAEVLAVPVDLMPPPSPSGLQAVPSINKVHLIWDEPETDDSLAYFIYRQKNNELAMEKLNSGPVRANHYIDGSVKSGEVYQYAVTAVDDSPQKNESGPSATVKVRIPEL